MRETEVAVVGAGILGLAFAFAHARRGRKVALFERNPAALGASVRNFGLVWPIGQAPGLAHDRAMRAREIWLEVIARADLWHAPSGSLHLAYQEDEWAVLQEYAALAASEARGRRLISPEDAARLGPIRPERLRGALWSSTEWVVDPRQAIRSIPGMLHRDFGVELCFGTRVTGVDTSRVETSRGEWKAAEIVLCSGSDLQSLYGGILERGGLRLCKLQMMRTAPQPKGWSLGPIPCSGLTIARYDCFGGCPSLPGLRRRLQHELPFHTRYGIHALLSPTPTGALTLGDSHEYTDPGETLEPFNREDINGAILESLDTFARIPSVRIVERWNGVYAQLPGKTEFVATPAPGVTIATGLGGSGMTLAFGLAEDIVGGRVAV
jgi:FAD dependent oxidoreductase TIGR03364